MPERAVLEEIRRVLHRTPVLTTDHIHDLCDALLIGYDQWPAIWPPSPFTVYPYTKAVLAQLWEQASLVTLSNLSVVYGPSRMHDLRDQCGMFLTATYTSYELQARKPAFWLWRHIADQQSVPVCDIVHVGDLWYHDVCGAIAAGARAILLTKTHDPELVVPPTHEWPAGQDRIAIVDDLRDVPDVITQWQQP